MRYYFELEGEDHTRFQWECEANSSAEAIYMLEECYPEAKMLECISQDTIDDIEEERHERLKYEMDNDLDLRGEIWL